jgi:hypothetical protein
MNPRDISLAPVASLALGIAFIAIKAGAGATQPDRVFWCLLVMAGMSFNVFDDWLFASASIDNLDGNHEGKHSL